MRLLWFGMLWAAVALAADVTRGVMDDRGNFQSGIAAQAGWRKVRIAFAELKRSGGGGVAPWTGADLLALEFAALRKPGEKAWLELDNDRFPVK